MSKSGSVMLLHEDGRLLARYPPIPIELAAARTDIFRKLITHIDQTAVRRTGAFDGIERLTAVSHLPRHALMVTVSEPFSAVIAGWWAQLRWFAGFSALG